LTVPFLNFVLSLTGAVEVHYSAHGTIDWHFAFVLATWLFIDRFTHSLANFSKSRQLTIEVRTISADQKVSSESQSRYNVSGAKGNLFYLYEVVVNSAIEPKPKKPVEFDERSLSWALIRR